MVYLSLESDAEVWVQGGFEGEHQTHAKFQSTIQSDPTVLHHFLEPLTH